METELINIELANAGFSYTIGAITAVGFVTGCALAFFLAAGALGELMFAIERWVRRRRERK